MAVRKGPKVSKSGRSYSGKTVVDRGGRSGLSKSGKGKRVTDWGGRRGLSKRGR
jgi:hypothetical protein